MIFLARALPARTIKPAVPHTQIEHLADMAGSIWAWVTATHLAY